MSDDFSNAIEQNHPSWDGLLESSGPEAENGVIRDLQDPVFLVDDQFRRQLGMEFSSAALERRRGKRGSGGGGESFQTRRRRQGIPREWLLSLKHRTKVARVVSSSSVKRRQRERNSKMSPQEESEWIYRINHALKNVLPRIDAIIRGDEIALERNFERGESDLCQIALKVDPRCFLARLGLAGNRAHELLRWRMRCFWANRELHQEDKRRELVDSLTRVLKDSPRKAFRVRGCCFFLRGIASMDVRQFGSAHQDFTIALRYQIEHARLWRARCRFIMGFLRRAKDDAMLVTQAELNQWKKEMESRLAKLISRSAPSIRLPNSRRRKRKAVRQRRFIVSDCTGDELLREVNRLLEENSEPRMRREYLQNAAEHHRRLVRLRTEREERIRLSELRDANCRRERGSRRLLPILKSRRKEKQRRKREAACARDVNLLTAIETMRSAFPLPEQGTGSIYDELDRMVIGSEDNRLHLPDILLPPRSQFLPGAVRDDVSVESIETMFSHLGESPAGPPVVDLSDPSRNRFAAAVEAISVVHYVSVPDGVAEEENIATCAICLDSVSVRSSIPVSRLRCSHEFHLRCIRQWAKSCGERVGCPLCRRPILD